MRKPLFVVFVVGILYVQTGLSQQTARTVDGVNYKTVQQAINSFGAPGNCGVVSIPQGTYKANIVLNSSNTCSNPSNMLIIRGAGRRNTILEPEKNACVITIDATDGPVQGIEIEDLGFSNHETKFSGADNSAICITGNKINDEHLFRRLWMRSFNHGVAITGRCIWCKFIDDEITESTGVGFIVNNNAASGLVGLLTLDQVKLDGAVGPCLSINTSSGANTGIAFRDSTAQDCTQQGAVFANIDGLDVVNSDFEANGRSGSYENIHLGGTYLRGFNLRANHILGSTTGDGVVVAATLTSGSIDGNFISVPTGKATVRVESSVSGGVVSIGCNTEANGRHAISADANTTYHAVDTCGAKSIAPNSTNASGTITPSVTGISNLRFTNTSGATVTNFTGGDPGQTLTVFNDGTSTVTFQHSNAKGLYMPGATSLTLQAGETCQFVFVPSSSRWIAYGCTNVTSRHAKKTSGTCTTAASSYSFCQDTLKWEGGAFASTPTTVTCTGVNPAIAGSSNIYGTLNVSSYDAMQVVTNTVTQNNAAFHFGEIDCTGFQ